MALAALLLMARCAQEDLNSTALDQSSIDLAQTSGQLASGTSFSISGSTTDSTSTGFGRRGAHGRHGHKGGGKFGGLLDGLHLLAPTDELLAIIDAETAGDMRGLRISKTGGATITHYNAQGEVVTLPLPDKNGPHGCSFSGRQFPANDSLLATIVKTVVDFGTGVTYRRDTVEITRAGAIVIERSSSGNTRTETIAFNDYSVNGIKIQGTKTRITTEDGAGNVTSTTNVSGGSLTFADGSAGTWTSNRTRTPALVLDADSGRPESGTITTEVTTSATAADGSLIYSHKTLAPLVENVGCEERRRGPVSGIVETIYRTDNVSLDFGDGSCSNTTITITFNGVTTTKTIGG